MIAWYYWLNRHEFGQIPGDYEGLGSLACCSPWLQKIVHNWATEQQQQQFNVDTEKTEYNTDQLIEMCLILNCCNNK